MVNTTNHQGNKVKSQQYYFTPVRMAIFKKTMRTSAGKDGEKREPLYTVGGSVN